MPKKPLDKNPSSMDRNTKVIKMGAIVVTAIILIVIVAPLVINVAFQANAPCALLAAQWSAGDLLVYCGGIFSGLGTLLLGALTLYQNKLLRDETEMRIQAEKAQEYATFMPTIDLRDRNVFGDVVGLEVSNYSFTPIKDIVFSKIKGLDKEGDIKWVYDDVLLPMLFPGELSEVQIGYFNDECFQTQKPLETIKMEMSCLNQLGFKYSFNIQGIAKEAKTFGNPKCFRWSIEPIID